MFDEGAPDVVLDEPISEGSIEALQRLTRDIKRSATLLTPGQARWLVDMYYSMQNYRIRAKGQIRAGAEQGEPSALLEWTFKNFETWENDVKRALDAYSKAQVVGRWAQDICGIGPVLSAGLLAHVYEDIKANHTQTVGHIWAFAGLDPRSVWYSSVKAAAIVKNVVGDNNGKLSYANVVDIAMAAGRKPEPLWKHAGGEGKETVDRGGLLAALSKRPWNGRLKVLCYKIGESFVKVQARESDVYGKVYVERKAEELRRNNMRVELGDPEQVFSEEGGLVGTKRAKVFLPIVPGEPGEYAEQARAALAERNFGEDTDARRWYAMGMLPPAQIHARARRYAVKLFLSHYHHVCFETAFGTPPPKPYILTQPNHTHFIAPPNWPMS